MCAGSESHTYTEDFAYFRQKEQSKIKMKLKQRKSTWDSPHISHAAIFAVSLKTQLYGYFRGKDKNPAVSLTLLVLAFLQQKLNTVLSLT